MDCESNLDCDRNARRDEIEALTAIYPGDVELKEDEMVPLVNGEWRLHSHPGAIITVRPHEDLNPTGSSSCNVRLDISTPEEYPSCCAPTYRLSAPFLRGEQKEKLLEYLDERSDNNIGECILYDWIEIIKDYLQEIDVKRILTQSKDASELTSHNKPGTVDCELSDRTRDSCVREGFIENEYTSSQVSTCPEIYTGNVIEDRKSAFQGHFARVDDVQKVNDVLSKLMENRKIKNATHPIIHAYRIQQKGRSGYFQDCDDNGEGGAGSRLLHLLNIMDAQNTLVVVTRWFGGIKLGSERWKHINNASRNAIEGGLASEITQETSESQKSKIEARGRNAKEKK